MEGKEMPLSPQMLEGFLALVLPHLPCTHILIYDLLPGSDDGAESMQPGDFGWLVKSVKICEHLFNHF